MLSELGVSLLGCKKEPKVEEDVKLSTIDFIKEQNKLDSLSNDELGSSIAYYVMSKRRYYNI